MYCNYFIISHDLCCEEERPPHVKSVLSVCASCTLFLICFSLHPNTFLPSCPPPPLSLSSPSIFLFSLSLFLSTSDPPIIHPPLCLLLPSPPSFPSFLPLLPLSVFSLMRRQRGMPWRQAAKTVATATYHGPLLLSRFVGQRGDVNGCCICVAC